MKGLVLAGIAGLWTVRLLAQEGDAARIRAALIDAPRATEARLTDLKSLYSGVVLALGGEDAESAEADRRAAERILGAGLELHYFIEIARCPELAQQNPRWMASLQGHPEWRRLHKEFPQPTASEVVKAYPWTPILYREAFDAHLVRVTKLLAARPSARSVFLNDLQGAPSACGCGNPVCRWTSDYGPILTATKLGDDAAARFVAAVKRIAPATTHVVPIWVTECEEHDKARHALCAGVACYQGICWKAYARQLPPLAAQSETLGALLLYKEFSQDVPHYEQPAGWIGHALKHGFTDQLVKNGAPPIAASRLVAVLQGWDASDAEIQAQIEQARSAGAGGWIVALTRIDQSWQPRIISRN